MGVLCSGRLFSNGVSIRICSARTVDTSLLLSHTRVFYRYKLLMFGVMSALEKYQQIVVNIVDSLIIHGKGVEEYD